MSLHYFLPTRRPAAASPAFEITTVFATSPTFLKNRLPLNDLQPSTKEQKIPLNAMASYSSKDSKQLQL